MIQIGLKMIKVLSTAGLFVMLLSCDILTMRERTSVNERDYLILSRIFEVENSKHFFTIKKIYFQKGGLGAPGELIFKIAAPRDNFTDLLNKTNFITLEHGMGKTIFPFETSFSQNLGESTTNLPSAYLLQTNITYNDQTTTKTKTYLFVDFDSSPSLSIYIKTDPIYEISKLAPDGK